jgi:SAM-dependent methyltransferase
VTEFQDPYAALAPIYDEWHELLTSTWVVRLETQLERFGVVRERLSFLDLGCGTGTLLIALRTRHPSWRLAGLDVSPAMLAQARRKPGAETITWLEGSFEDAARQRDFDVVGCFFDAFDHAVEEGAFAAAIQAAAKALAPGGLLVFDLNDRRGSEDRSLTSSRIDRREWGISMDHHFDASSAIETTTIVVRRDQGPSVETAVRRRCFSPDEVSRTLHAAGLGLELHESWSLVRGEIASKRWYVARKR